MTVPFKPLGYNRARYAFRLANGKIYHTQFIGRRTLKHLADAEYWRTAFPQFDELRIIDTLYRMCERTGIVPASYVAECFVKIQKFYSDHFAADCETFPCGERARIGQARFSWDEVQTLKELPPARAQEAVRWRADEDEARNIKARLECAVADSPLGRELHDVAEKLVDLENMTCGILTEVEFDD